MFETYGDRMTQHSHDWPVSEEFAIDYLFSLAAAMLDDEELAEKASHSFSGGVHKDTLKFAASLVFNPDKDKEWGKTRYFSMSLGKVTRDREKQHDDRYKQLNEYQDGTPKSILAPSLTSIATGWRCTWVCIPPKMYQFKTDGGGGGGGVHTQLVAHILKN